MKQFNIHSLLYPISVCIVILLLISANRVKMPYTPYQILVWEIKANEGYSSTWYPDGYFKGKRSYSIGFGWNDLGRTRRSEIKQYLKDGMVSYNEAIQITQYEIKKYGKLHSDPYKNLALCLYSYNCGLTKSGSKIGRCCGSTWLCGNKDRNIRKAHSRRRKFELALWKKDVPTIIKYTEENRQKIIANCYLK